MQLMHNAAAWHAEMQKHPNNMPSVSLAVLGLKMPSFWFAVLDLFHIPQIIPPGKIIPNRIFFRRYVSSLTNGGDLLWICQRRNQIRLRPVILTMSSSLHGYLLQLIGFLSMIAKRYICSTNRTRILSLDQTQ